MNNDLISRSELLKAFANSEHIKETNSGLDVMEMLAIKEIIDNAPTVKIDTNDIEYKAYCKGLEDGKQIARQQGEWIGKEKYDDYPNKTVCECSECGKMICVSHNDFPNFCENCGADMRKGGAENR